MNSHTNIMRGWVFEGPVHETLSEFLETVQSLQCRGYNVSKCMCLYSQSAGGVGYYCRPTQQLLFPSLWSYLNTAGNSRCKLQTSTEPRDNCGLDFLHFLLGELKLATTAALSPFIIKYSRLVLLSSGLWNTVVFLVLPRRNQEPELSRP